MNHILGRRNVGCQQGNVNANDREAHGLASMQITQHRCHALPA